MLYAVSYSETMLHRALEENPDFFEDKGMSKGEFMAHMQNNLCLGQLKYRQAMFKQTAADLSDDHFTNDRVRRLVNGGDRFHPYL